MNSKEINNINDSYEKENINEKFFLSQYLQETQNKVNQPFTTLKWLQNMDDDTLKMLDSYYNNFNVKKKTEDINEIEVLDLFSLVQKIILLETGLHEFDEQYPDEAQVVQYLAILTNAEILRRKQMIEIHGQGLITNPKTTSFIHTK